MSWKEETDQIIERRKWAKIQGGEEGVARQHAKGRLTIRERINGVLDADTFKEQGETAGKAELDADGNIVAMTMEHARKRSDAPNLSFEEIAA